MISDETLMAYADGELDEQARSAVERAIRADPALAARVARHKALRSQVFSAFAPVLDEPVPQRLRPVPGSGSGKVVQLDAVRAGRRQPPAAGGAAGAPGPRRWSWPEWGALAATLVIGVAAGSLGMRGAQDGGQGEAQVAALATSGGALTAQGQLAAALSQQLASVAPPDPALRIGVSFVSKDGAYCRSFSMGGSAGLACKQGEQWAIPLLAAAAPATGGGAGGYRQAGSEMPAAVLDAIDQRIAGQALDAAAERAALQRGWKR